MKNIVPIFLSAMIANPAHSKDQSKTDESTLCNDDESIYYSCHIKDKGTIISLCAAGNSSPNDGYVQYRYGTHSNIEFTYPKNKIPPAGIFSLSDISEGSIRGLHVKFTSPPYTYVISSSMPDGLYVIKNKKIAFEGYCESGRNTSFPFEAYKGLEQKPISDSDIH